MQPPFRHALLVGAVLTTTLAAPAPGQVEPPIPIDEVRPVRRSSKAEAAPPPPTPTSNSEAAAPPPTPGLKAEAAMPPPTRAPRTEVGAPLRAQAAKADAGVPLPAQGRGASPASAPSNAERGPKPLLPPKATDEELLSAWRRWHKGILDPDTKLAEQAQRELLALKGDLGVADLDAFAIGFIRAAEAKMKSNDPMTAVALAGAAVELAPDLPHGHFMLARAYAFADPSDVSRYVSALARSLRCLWADPRYRRAALATWAFALFSPCWPPLRR